MAIIQEFNINLSDLPAVSERRDFTIFGNGLAEFRLEVKDNTTGYYYNFVKKTFSSRQSFLEDATFNGRYDGSITFPAVTGSDDQYDIYLYAINDTIHTRYQEARFGDGTLDINNSIGSNSLVMQKVIYQYAALTLTLTGYSPNSTVSGTAGTDTVSINRGKAKVKTAFSFTYTAGATAAYRVLRQPTSDDFIAFVQPVVGTQPINLPNENIYPTVNNTDTTNATMSSTDLVTMTSDVADKMKEGDRVTGTGISSSDVVTVLNITSGTAKQFRASQNVSISSGVTLSFSNRMNYSWPITNFAHLLKKGMIVVPDGLNVTADTSIGDYEDTLTLFEGTKRERKFVRNRRSALSTLGKKPTVVKGLVTVQEGQVIFDKQQVLALGGDTLRVGGYGESEILRVFDWDVRFTDLAVTLTSPTTTTSGAVSASATIGVADREGVINNVSRLSGIGVDSSVQNPLITAGGGADGAGNFTVDAAQTLESGITLTIENTGRIATITGNIEIIKAGTADQTIRIDVENLLSTSA